MRKTYKYEVIKEVDFIDIDCGTKENIVVFKEKIITPYYTKENQGFCNKKEIDNLSKKQYIETLDKILLTNSFIQGYSLSLEEEHGWLPYDKEIAYPYDYIEKFGLKDVSLCRFCFDTAKLYDARNKLIPRGILIDFYPHNGGMTNTAYDLENVLLKIKNSPKVRLLGSYHEGLIDIPSYAKESKKASHYLSFIVSLTFDEYRIFKSKKRNKFDYILDELLELEEFKCSEKNK